MNEALRLKLSLLPDSPGCYLMKERGQIIYVGKAVNLRSRVPSYFRAQGHTPKVAALVGRIDDFDTILASSNLEALMLESNLIKLHKPYYNILLKDDKRYPYIRFDLNAPFPRLTIARKLENDGAKYFGPYIGANAIRQVMNLLHVAFPLRTCNLNLPLKTPIRPCINYDIGRCLGPCAHKCTQEEYAEVVQQVLGFLKGNYQPAIRQLEAAMQQSAQAMQYERAAELRDCIRDIRGLMEQQNAQSANRAEQDIIALSQDGLDAMAQVLFIRGGKMLGGDHYALPREGREPLETVLSAFVQQYYEERIPAREVLVEAVEDRDMLESWLRERRGGPVSLTVPQRGDKKDLIDNARKNAADQLQKRNAQQRVLLERTVGAQQELTEALGLESTPRRIEGFDISNTQGQLSVASMVVFIDGMPAKKEYRRFRIKTVAGANDFASMNEVLRRRFLRAKAPEEKDRWPLPDLVLVDGGPEQLRFAREAMLEAGFDVPMFGLAERLEEIWLPGSKQPVVLDHRKPALQLVQRIRDESHRFAITHHRTLRGKALTHSRLEDVAGIGPGRRRALLSHFRTLQAIKEASLEDLLAVKGMNRKAAENLYAAFHDAPHAAPDA